MKLNPPKYQQQVALRNFQARLEHVSPMPEDAVLLDFQSDTIHHALLIAEAEAEKRSLRLVCIADLGPSSGRPV